MYFSPPSLAIPTIGSFDLYVSYSSSISRATNVPIIVNDDSGTGTEFFNQQVDPAVDGFRFVANYQFSAGVAEITIGNAGTNGKVVVDSVRLVCAENGTF